MESSLEWNETICCMLNGILTPLFKYFYSPTWLEQKSLIKVESVAGVVEKFWLFHVPFKRSGGSSSGFATAISDLNSPFYIVQITDLLEFLHEYCKEKSETFTEFVVIKNTKIICLHLQRFWRISTKRITTLNLYVKGTHGRNSC